MTPSEVATLLDDISGMWGARFPLDDRRAAVWVKALAGFHVDDVRAGFDYYCQTGTREELSWPITLPQLLLMVAHRHRHRLRVLAHLDRDIVRASDVGDEAEVLRLCELRPRWEIG